MAMRNALIIAFLAATVSAQRDPGPQPREVSPGAPGGAPSDAIALDHAKWRTKDGAPNKCTASAGVMSCSSGAGDIVSTETFRSAQIHVEFRPPLMPDQKGQRKGNSGVYIHGRYELQVLDSFKNPTYATGMLGALYGQAPPLVNAAKPPGEWQSYDIVFRAPVCDAAGKIVKPATVTALVNGVLVQDHVEIDAAKADQEHKQLGDKGLCDAGPLKLQDHSGFPNAPHTTLEFRNIWFRRLD